MADEITEQLLATDQRSSWCGDTDPTGRYVCQRIRDHALDWHAARNSEGGVHQWPAACPAEVVPAIPVDCPVGTVLVDPETGRWAVRFTRGDDTGKGQHVWLSPAGVVHAQARFLHHADVRGWEVAEARRWGRVADPDPPANTDLRARCIAALNGMPSEFISPDEFGGYDIHYGELVDIVLAEVQPELADLRASREAWAIEAVGLDGLADKVLTWFDQLLTAAAKATGVSVSLGLKTVLPALELLATERATTQAEVARLTRERDALSGMLRGMARRATILRRERNLARSSRDQYHRNWDRCREANGTALQTISALKLDRVALSGLLRGMARRASGQRRSKERLAMWAEARRPAIPADTATLVSQWLLDHSGAKYDDYHSSRPAAQDLIGFLNAWRPAPVSGSDTTEVPGEH